MFGTHFKTLFGCGRRQSSCDCVAHKLLARPRFKISLKMGSKNLIILCAGMLTILAGCQLVPPKMDPDEKPAVLTGLTRGVADPAVKALVDRVSEKQYRDYQLMIESMGRGLYGGEVYNMGFRNRDMEGTTGSLGNEEACLYLQDSFKEMGLTLTVQGNYKNVVGELTGTVTPEKIYVIGAHYDHIAGDMPGGDDNASGVASVLEAARILSQCKFESTIRFIAFNAEEDAKLGSKDYVKKLPKNTNIIGMVNLDTILRPGSDAKPDRPIDVEIETNGPLTWVRAYAQAMVDYVPSLVLGDIWDYAESSSDNDSFQNQGIPAFLIIENSDGDWYAPNPIANPYIHHREDASDRRANDPSTTSSVTYDYAFAANITRAVVALIAQEARLANTAR